MAIIKAIAAIILIAFITYGFLAMINDDRDGDVG